MAEQETANPGRLGRVVVMARWEGCSEMAPIFNRRQNDRNLRLLRAAEGWGAPAETRESHGHGKEGALPGMDPSLCVQK